MSINLNLNLFLKQNLKDKNLLRERNQLKEVKVRNLLKVKERNQLKVKEKSQHKNQLNQNLHLKIRLNKEEKKKSKKLN